LLLIIELILPALRKRSTGRQNDMHSQS
jgi:hypothetical protein